VSAVAQPSPTLAAGPFFEDLSVGDRVDRAPGLTLTDGLAAAHRAILGGRLRLALDAELCHAVTGERRLLADPQLVCDVAIGQSTLLTQRVIANLFYRGLRLRRLPRIGDTLRTSTEVVALRQTTPRPGRPATGLAALRIRTLDQEDRPVLDFHRCAMLPLRDGGHETGHADDLAEVGASAPAPGALAAVVAGWDLAAFRGAVGSGRGDAPRPGASWRVEAGDVVSCAPELARLSLNVAAAHHDAGATASGRRLVYGGHTIGLAAAQATRALPNLLTIVAWHSCDHLAPVFEGDTLTSRIELERVEPPGTADAEGPALLHLRSRVRARRADGGEAADVLDWRFVAASP
jgi:acyl dehydratase